MAKKEKAPKGAGAKAAGAALLSGLLGGGLIASPQARLNEIRPTPFAPPKTKGKGKGR